MGSLYADLLCGSVFYAAAGDGESLCDAVGYNTGHPILRNIRNLFSDEFCASLLFPGRAYVTIGTESGPDTGPNRKETDIHE